MSSRVDYSALWMYRAALDTGPSGIQSRYFVPLAAIDALDVRRRSAPLSWGAGAGSTEMRLQRYNVPLVLSGGAAPDNTTTFPGATGTAEINIFVENMFDSASIFVGYNIPTNLTPYASVSFGSPTVSSSGASGTIVVPPSGTGSFSFNVEFSTAISESGLINAMILPGSFFTYEGEPWEADVTISVFWNFQEF